MAREAKEKYAHAGQPVKQASKDKFLQVYADCGTIELAAKESDVNRRTISNWVKSDPVFATKIGELKPLAKQTYLGVLEQEAHRRAVEGVLEPVYYQGQLVDRVRKFSDVLLIVLLKANAPEKYVERHELSGKDGGAIPISIIEVVRPNATQ